MISRANRVLAAAITWLVIMFGCYYVNLARPGLGTRWEQLPPLPGPGTTVELTRFGYVLATTESGAAYRRDPWQTDGPWVLYDEAAEEFYGEPCQADDGSRFGVSSPPGKVVARSSGDCVVSAETSVHAEVALVENGEVWMWTYSYGGAGVAYLSLLLLAAGALGVVMLVIGGVMKLLDQ
jgi:hypothetical protein